MDIIYEIRRRYLVQKQMVTDIAKDMGLSRPTVRKHILTVEEPKYKREQTPAPKLTRLKHNSRNGSLKTPNLQDHAVAMGSDYMNVFKPLAMLVLTTACNALCVAGNPVTTVQS